MRMVVGHPLVMIDSGKPKCMTVDVADNSHILVEYEAPDVEHTKAGVWMTLDVVEPLESLRESHHKNNHPVGKKLSESITKTKGTFSHEVEYGGKANVCIRAPPASTSKPMFFSLIVSTGHATQFYDHEKAEHHLSSLEIQTMKLQDEMEEILNEADYSKEREMLFHDQTIKMEAATTWWPIVQVFVLLLTGYTQASHMVRFFKSRHII